MKLLVIDNDTFFSAGLLAAVAADHPDLACTDLQGGLIRSAPSGLQPDIVLLNYGVNIEEKEGLLAGVQEAFPASKIAYLFEADNQPDYKRSTGRGVSGFIDCQSKTSIVYWALKIIMSDGLYIPAQAIAMPLSTARTSNRSEGITPRQQQIVSLIIEGLKNKEIASNLNLSINTVKIHIRRIMKAFDINSRSQLKDVSDSQWSSINC